jgi:hypothetical protein
MRFLLLQRLLDVNSIQVFLSFEYAKKQSLGQRNQRKYFGTNEWLVVLARLTTSLIVASKRF